MSLLTDKIFVKALRSNEELLSKLPARDVYNTSIPVPDAEFDNAKIPYVIVAFDSLLNDNTTKDCSYEGETDRVQISIEVVAKTRPQLGELTTTIRRTVREFFENITEYDEDYKLVPLDYTFSAQQIIYDGDKPAFGQTLVFQCDTEIDDNEQD